MLKLLQTYLIGTPDFGHSDIWHFNFALKFLLSSALKHGYLPFWSKDMGTGFPLLAEGQIGMFNLYNLLAFKLLNPILAMNLGITVTILTTATGTYLFSRALRFNRLSSIFTAVIFSLSGVFITQITHYNLIQAASFLPWEFFLTEKFLQSRQKKYLILLPFIISQQIFAGFQQLVMISLVSLAIYILSRPPENRPIKSLVFIAISLVTGLLLSLPQLLPSLEYFNLSFRKPGLPLSSLAQYPFRPADLLRFFAPYLFGDPRKGTYPPFGNNWGIFWESTGYIGILPLFLVALTLLSKTIRKSQGPIIILLLVSFILLLGKFTPFFFLYQLPPLSLFRVPARFIFPFVFGLTILAGAGLNKLPKKIAIIALAISFLDLGNFASHYHAVVNAKDWLKPPESVVTIRQDKSWYRIFSIPPYAEWNSNLLLTNGSPDKHNRGWQDMTIYFPFRNAIDSNQNLYWSLPAVDSYAGLYSRRSWYFTGLAIGGVVPQPNIRAVSVSTSSAKLLSLTGVKYIISPYQIRPDNLASVSASLFLQTTGNPSFYIYENRNAKPHAYLTRNYLTAVTIADLERKVTNADSSATVLEEPVDVEKASDPIAAATVLKNDDLEVTIQASASAQSLLILSDSYYPGWKAYLDQRPVRILPANLNQRAIIFPEGNHIVDFVYRPLEIF